MFKERINTPLTPFNTLFVDAMSPWATERSLCVDDEILLEAPIEATDEVALIFKRTMEEAGKTLLKIVPAEVEVVIAGSWAEK